MDLMIETGLRAAEPLLNRERASEIMRRTGLSALLLTAPLNVYYATRKTLVTERFTTVAKSAALVPADLAAPIGLIGSGFDFYFSSFDGGLPPGVQPYLAGARGHVDVHDPMMSPVHPDLGEVPLSPRERRLRAQTHAAGPMHADFNAALTHAFADLAPAAGMIGADTQEAEAFAARAAPRLGIRRADDVMLHIRAIKTPAELALVRVAAHATVAAVLAGAEAAREAGTVRGLRARIYSEMALRELTPIFGAIAGVVDETFEEDLTEGQSFMVDFVGHHGFYQGDFGRTVFMGEPARAVRNVAAAVATVWEDLRQQLRPGLRFSEIHDRGAAMLRRHDPRYTAAFNPHLVGLQHWDQPRTGLDGAPLDLALEPGMILSVDCPMLMEGVGGSTHLEDLLMITATGAELLHDPASAVIVA